MHPERGPLFVPVVSGSGEVIEMPPPPPLPQQQLAAGGGPEAAPRHQPEEGALAACRPCTRAFPQGKVLAATYSQEETRRTRP